MEWADSIVLLDVVEQARGEVVDEDGAVALFGTHVALLTVWILRFEEFVNLACAHYAVGKVVDVAVHLVALASLHTDFLLTEWAEKVLHQSPVEVCSVLVGPCALEVGKFSYLNEWVLGGGNESFFLIEVEEHIECVANLRSLWYVACREQDVAYLASFKV